MFQLLRSGPARTATGRSGLRDLIDRLPNSAETVAVEAGDQVESGDADPVVATPFTGRQCRPRRMRENLPDGAVRTHPPVMLIVSASVPAVKRYAERPPSGGSVIGHRSWVTMGLPMSSSTVASGEARNNPPARRHEGPWVLAVCVTSRDMIRAAGQSL